MPEPPTHTQTLVKKEDFTLSKMRAPRPVVHDSAAASVNRNDILFALFKHKKKILIGAIAGLVVAAGVFFFWPRAYESDAVLLVRYLVERSAIDSTDSPKNPGGYMQTTDTLVAAEVSILSSWDLAVQTAEAIGPKRLGAATREAAAGTIASGLTATTSKNSTIISVAYRNSNPELAPLVLNELLNRYFIKHLEVHRSAGAFDFVQQQTDQVHARLTQTEDALKDIKGKAGIASLNGATDALSREAEKTKEQLHKADDDLAEQQARVQQVNGSVATASVTPGPAKAAASPAGAATAGQNATPENGKPEKSEPAAAAKAVPPPKIVQKYQLLVSGLGNLRKTQVELFAKYTPKSKMVKANQSEIDDADKERRDLEKKYPDLPLMVGPTGSSKMDRGAEIARLVGLQAKKDALTARLNDAQQRIQQLSQLSPQIADLERQKQMQEDNYKYFETTLEKARVDEALDPSKIPNISAVQRPSPPARVTKTRNKVMAGAAVGGFALAVFYALLKELVLSGSVRRGVEIEKFVGINALMSIPYCSSPNGASPSTIVKRNGKLAAVVPNFGSGNLAPWDSNHFIHPYSEAIRDRLGLYFELHNLTHKPKLVGVTGLSKAAGTSTLAAGLAAALSETNDGKVLLVDVSLGPDHVHPFFKGKPAYPLTTALKSNGQMEAAAENLYLATVGSSNAGPAKLGLKKFFDLMPNLKASDFDYIIFDMPPLDQTSSTWGMAPFMDKMLLVVEAEKNSRDAMKRSYRRLVVERDNVAVVLNKVPSYAPKRLELEH